jgi:hypothetical protein
MGVPATRRANHASLVVIVFVLVVIARAQEIALAAVRGKANRGRGSRSPNGQMAYAVLQAGGYTSLLQRATIGKRGGELRMEKKGWGAVPVHLVVAAAVGGPRVAAVGLDRRERRRQDERRGGGWAAARRALVKNFAGALTEFNLNR